MVTQFNYDQWITSDEQMQVVQFPFVNGETAYGLFYNRDVSRVYQWRGPQPTEPIMREHLIVPQYMVLLDWSGEVTWLNKLPRFNGLDMLDMGEWFNTHLRDPEEYQEPMRKWWRVSGEPTSELRAELTGHVPVCRVPTLPPMDPVMVADAGYYTTGDPNTIKELQRSLAAPTE